VHRSAFATETLPSPACGGGVGGEGARQTAGASSRPHPCPLPEGEGVASAAAVSRFRFPLSRRRRARAGVSLLEVLIAIFVLMFGLLGVAAVIPVGRLRIVQTAQADRSAACGTAALHEVKTRRMLDPTLWRRRDPDSTQPDQPVAQSSRLPRRFSFAIDPLFVAATRNVADSAVVQQLRYFPYFYDNPNAGPMPKMWRVTLDADPSPQGYVPMPLAAADRIFTWQDDLRLPVPDDDADRPRQVTSCLDNNANPAFSVENIAWPARLADDKRIAAAKAADPNYDLSLITPCYPQCDGNYSWLVTVTPKHGRATTGEVLNPNIYNDRLYWVSVVVFYNRDFSPPDNPLDPAKPGERRVQAQVLGGGWSGGEVRLITPGSRLLPNNAVPTVTQYTPEYLDVKKGQWLLLMAGDVTPAPSTPPFLLHWYRIVSVGDTLSEDLDGSGSVDPGEDFNGNNEIDWFREVTLAGPDWEGPTFQAANPAGTTVEAALFTGVIGVYTRVMELDDIGSLWSN